MTADSAAPTRRRTPRRKRAARIVRGLLALLIVGLLGIWYALETDATADRVRRLIETRASAALGASVTIGRLELDAVPFHLEAHDVFIGPPRPTLAANPDSLTAPEPGSELAGIDRLVLDLSPWGLLRNRVTILNLELHRPRLDLDLPLPERDGGVGAGTLALDLRRLRIRDGSLKFGHREARLSGDLQGIMLQLAPESTGFLASQRTAGVGDLQIAGGRLDLSDRNGEGAVFEPVELALRFGRGEQVLDIDSLRLVAGDSLIEARGPLRGFDSADLDVTGQIALTDIFKLWVPPGPVDHAGRADFRGTLQLRDGAPILAGRLQTGTARAAGLALDRLTADLELHGEAVVLRDLRSDLYGGTLQGELYVDRRVQPAQVRIDYAAQGIDTAAASRWQPSLGFRAAGRLNGQGSIAWSRPFSATASGSGQLQLQVADVGSLELSRRLQDAARPAVGIGGGGVEPADLSPRSVGHAAPSLPLPADASIEYRLADGVLQLPSVIIGLPGATVTANGRVDLDGDVLLAVQADATDLRMIDHGVAQYRAFREGRPEWKRLGLRGAGTAELTITGTLRALDVAGAVQTRGLVADDLILGDIRADVRTEGRALISDNLVIQRRGGAAAGRAQLKLPGGDAATVPADSAPTDYEVELRLDGYALEAERDFAGLPEHLTGTATGAFLLRGDWGDVPLSQFDLSAQPARLGATDFDEITVRGRRSETAWLFDAVEVRGLGGLVTGAGLWGNSPRLTAFNVSAHDLDVAAVCAALTCGRQLGGRLDADGELSGQLESVTGDLEAVWANAEVGDLPLGRVVGSARAEAGVLAVRLLGSTDEAPLPTPAAPLTTTGGVAPTLLPDPPRGWSASATIGTQAPYPVGVRLRAGADVVAGVAEQWGRPLPELTTVEGQFDLEGRGESDDIESWRGTATLVGLRVQQPPSFLVTADVLRAALEGGVLSTVGDLETAAGPLTVDTRVGLADRSLAGTLDGSWDLAGLRLLDSELEAAGAADLRVQLGGLIEAPELRGEASIRSLSLNDGWMYPLTGFEADLSLAGDTVNIDRGIGHLGDEPFLLTGALPLRALAGNADATPARLRLQTDGLSIVPVVSRSESIHRLITGGTIAGALDVSGIGLDWKRWGGTAEVQGLELRMRDYLLALARPVRAPIAAARITLPEGTTIRDQRTDLQVSGIVDLAPLAVDLDLAGRMGFEPLNVLSAAWGAGGIADVDLRVFGAVGDLAYRGNAVVSGAVVSPPVLRQPIESIRAQVRFDDRRIRIEEGVGELGGGGVTLAGEVFLSENVPSSFRLTAAVDSANVRLERDVRVRASADVVHDGTPSGSVLSGTVTLHEGMYRRQLLANDALLEMLEAPETDPDPLLQAIALDLRVRGGDNLFIDNNLADVEVTADLNVRGTAARPVVLGRSVVLGGRLFWNGNLFDVTQGTVEYNNPFETDPTFEIRARTEIRRYTIDLSFSGSLQRGVSFNYTSTPSLSDLDLFNLLAFGEEPDSAVFQDPYSYQRALGLQATRYLTDAYLSEVERGAERLFGVDRFRVAPTVTGTETDATARLTLGKRIDRNLYVTYSRLLSTSEDQLLTVEYRLTPAIRVKGTRDADGSFGIDFLIQRRIR